MANRGKDKSVLEREQRVRDLKDVIKYLTDRGYNEAARAVERMLEEESRE